MKQIQSKLNTKRYLLSISRNWGLYLLLLPAFVLTLIFAYRPMYGVLMAFKDYKPSLGIMGSPWTEPWYKYFERFWKSFQFKNTIQNTLIINLYSLVAGFPLPILMALIVNQMQAKRFKRVFQTITYMPHFISTVVMVGILLIFLSPGSGLIGNIYALFGATAPNLLASPKAFYSVYVWSDIWQHVGWDSIIYLAALSSVDPSLYEAATVDGASRWQKIKHIDFNTILPTAVILMILRMGSLMGLGFEKVYLMQNDLNLMGSEVISTYVYKMGIISTQYSYSAAISMFNTIINFILLIAVNQVARRMSESSLW